jgi:hypothetical protein
MLKVIALAYNKHFQLVRTEQKEPKGRKTVKDRGNPQASSSPPSMASI